METINKTTITIDAFINANVEKVWQLWTLPEHIVRWNQASVDWHTPYARNDLKTGGKFLSRMEAIDGSAGFDFEGVYDEITLYKSIGYTMGDGRKVKISFSGIENETKLVICFDAEDINSVELQRNGWQAILDNFKKYAGSN